jgi:hypothetical protein
MKAAGNIVRLMRIVGAFAGVSWAAWSVVLRAMFGAAMSGDDLALYQRLSGRTQLPSSPVREAWFIVGRRGGKSIIAALIAVYQTTCRTFRLAPGERGTFMVIAADRKQARVVKRYISALLHAHPALGELVEKETDERIDLTNGLTIEIHTASFRTLRGYTVIGAVCDEVAFWQSDDAANPDTEILGALRPAMATVPGAVLVCITSPYARRGEVWSAHQKHFGKDDAPVLVIQADSRTMNPKLPAEIVEQAYADDPAHAAAEYGAEFRKDVETFVSREIVEACVVPGRHEIAPQYNLTYAAFVDPSGGSSDSMTLAIAHEYHGRVVIDAIREQAAPFDPDKTVASFAQTLREYRVHMVRGDRYGGEWPAERFRKHGIEYRPADLTKSELYQAFLPRLNAATVELLDHERSVKQLLALERRTSRGGRESIDHPPKGKDDVINAVAGVAHDLRARRGSVAAIGLYDPLFGRCERRPESSHAEYLRCMAADAERIREGTQEAFLRLQGLQVSDWRDKFFH